MEGNKRYGIFLIVLYMISSVVSSCVNEMTIKDDSCTSVDISFSIEDFATKAQMPDEYIVRDVSVLVFDNRGSIVGNYWEERGVSVFRLKLLAGEEYTVCACANFGYPISVDTLEELYEERFYLNYPDEFHNGMPMVGMEKYLVPKNTAEGVEFDMMLHRLFAKISVCLDRSHLSDDVDMRVRSAKIGNCPKSTSVFVDNSVRDQDDCFSVGYRLNDSETAALNDLSTGSVSRSVSLYMLENLQGECDARNDADKVLSEKDPRFFKCSYLELTLVYESDSRYTISDDLIYRFYLGADESDMNIRRNTHYQITIIPEDDGLSESSWRVDQTAVYSWIQEIRLSEKSIALDYAGKEFQLTADVIPTECGDELLFWSSSDEAVASVSQAGVVTAVGEGECDIICETSDGSGVRAICNVSCDFLPIYFNLYPGVYIEGKVGDSVHVWCEFFPPNAPFDIGLEELETDRNRGIYDYVIDADGRGVVLTLKDTGSGLLYMEVGEPINKAEAVFLSVSRAD